jgi:hypothetical protein
MAERFCRVCGGWHDLNEPWPDACMGHYRRHKENESGQIIKDIEPYKGVGIPGNPIIGGRKQHRDAMRAHGLVELGNEKVTRKPLEAPPGLAQDILRSAQQMGHWKP